MKQVVMKQQHNQLIEGIGFFFEVLCFFLSGVLLFISFPLAILLFAVGLTFAIEVGKMIKGKS